MKLLERDDEIVLVWREFLGRLAPYAEVSDLRGTGCLGVRTRWTPSCGIGLPAPPNHSVARREATESIGGSPNCLNAPDRCEIARALEGAPMSVQLPHIARDPPI